VLALLAELESKRIEAEAGFERYLAVVASLYEVVALENALPKSAIDAQAALDRARAHKFDAMFKEKQHGRRIEELMLMFQFRKWLESRTIVGKAEQDGVFGVDTDEFLRRLDEYRKTLDDSLAFTDKLTSRKSDIHFFPAVIELPMYTVKELTASDAAPLAIDRDAMDKIGVWKHNLFENQCLNRLLTETDQVSTSLAETAIPAGVYTANGKTSEAIAVSELPALSLFNPDSFKAANSADWFMPGDDSEPFGRDAAGELTPPVLHNLDADVRRERKRRFETFIAELNRYDDARAVLDEAIAAAKYVDSAKASLDTTNEITTYVDWRLDYIRSYHGGVSARLLAFEKADAALQKAGFARSRDGVEITSGDLANVVGICVKRNDVITTIPQMIVDFLFGS
jgi:hypothetical protein